MKLYSKFICITQIFAAIVLSISSYPQATQAQVSRRQCWQQVRAVGGSKERAESVCANQPSFAGKCFVQIKNIGASWDRAESACKEGTPHSGECFIEVRELGATWEISELLCKNALVDTFKCVEEVRQNKQSWTIAQENCSLSTFAQTIQNCVNSLRFDPQGNSTGISDSVAVEVCLHTRSQNNDL